MSWAWHFNAFFTIYFHCDFYSFLAFWKMFESIWWLIKPFSCICVISTIKLCKWELLVRIKRILSAFMVQICFVAIQSQKRFVFEFSNRYHTWNVTNIVNIEMTNIEKDFIYLLSRHFDGPIYIFDVNMFWKCCNKSSSEKHIIL